RLRRGTDPPGPRLSGSPGPLRQRAGITQRVGLPNTAGRSDAGKGSRTALCRIPGPAPHGRAVRRSLRRAVERIILAAPRGRRFPPDAPFPNAPPAENRPVRRQAIVAPAVPPGGGRGVHYYGGQRRPGLHGQALLGETWTTGSAMPAEHGRRVEKPGRDRRDL